MKRVSANSPVTVEKWLALYGPRAHIYKLRTPLWEIFLNTLLGVFHLCFHALTHCSYCPFPN